MKTKGEVLISGLDQIREGLDMISKLGDSTDLVKEIVGSRAAADRLRNVMKDRTLVFNLVLSMVKARNGRLSEDTVQKVVTDFLDVLFDLSKPYRDIENNESEYVCPHGYIDSDDCPDCRH